MFLTEEFLNFTKPSFWWWSSRFFDRGHLIQRRINSYRHLFFGWNLFVNSVFLSIYADPFCPFAGLYSPFRKLIVKIVRCVDINIPILWFHFYEDLYPAHNFFITSSLGPLFCPKTSAAFYFVFNSSVNIIFPLWCCHLAFLENLKTQDLARIITASGNSRTSVWLNLTMIYTASLSNITVC